MKKLQNLIMETRTFRRFHENQALDKKILFEILDLARLGGSARNCQPWQYMIINNDDQCKNVFPHLGWAGYLSEWNGPAEGERPSAYILCLLNTKWLKGSEQEAHFDLGIASQNLLLGAQQKGIGGCRIGSFSPKLAASLDLPTHLKLKLVIALGKPREDVVLEECQKDNEIHYWRDENSVHHVPKRKLEDIIVTYQL